MEAFDKPINYFRTSVFRKRIMRVTGHQAGKPREKIIEYGPQIRDGGKRRRLRSLIKKLNMALSARDFDKLRTAREVLVREFAFGRFPEAKRLPA